MEYNFHMLVNQVFIRISQIPFRKILFFSDDKIYNVCRKNIEFQNIKEKIEKLLKYNQQ
jgi:hypothetical protein